MHDDVGNEREVEPDRGRAETAVDEGRRAIPTTLVGFVVLAIASLIFIIQNSSSAKVRFLLFSVTTRLWVAIAVAVALGIVLDRLFGIWWRRHHER